MDSKGNISPFEKSRDNRPKQAEAGGMREEEGEGRLNRADKIVPEKWQWWHWVKV